MKKESQTSNFWPINYRSESDDFIPEDIFEETPEISKEDHRRLPRDQRIYYSLRWPKVYPMSNVDEVYFEKVQIAYNILFSAETEQRAEVMIKNAFPGRKLSQMQVYNLISSAKSLFGNIEARNDDFDRMMLRRQLQDIVRRAKDEGDLKNERLALKQLAQLDALEIKKKEDVKPVIPGLPAIRFVTEIEAAEVVKSGDDEEE